MQDKINDYRDLRVWQKGISLAKYIYQLTLDVKFPSDEKFGLISQMRRASVSVPSNIAEGQARNSVKDFVRFLYISKGSLAELDTQAIIAYDLNFISENKFNELKLKIVKI